MRNQERSASVSATCQRVFMHSLRMDCFVLIGEVAIDFLSLAWKGFYPCAVDGILSAATPAPAMITNTARKSFAFLISLLLDACRSDRMGTPCPNFVDFS